MQNVQVCYTGIHMPWWFAAPINPSSTLGISPHAVPPLAIHPQHALVCDVSLLGSMCSHCSTPLMSENIWCLVFCSCISLLRMMVSSFIHVSTKDMNSSFFYGCIVFHGVYVPHFPCPVYHWWAFGLVQGRCYCKQCCDEHMSAHVFIIEWFIILGVYSQ